MLISIVKNDDIRELEIYTFFPYLDILRIFIRLKSQSKVP